MEFLMTYGWVLLVVLIIISVLAYVGFLEPSNIVPDRCSFDTSFSCSDFRVSENPSEISFTIFNSANKDIQIFAVNISSPGIVSFCQNLSFGPTGYVYVPAGQEYTVKVAVPIDDPGCTFVGNPDKKQKYSVDVIYKNADSIFNRTLSGEILTKREDGDFGESQSPGPPPPEPPPADSTPPIISLISPTGIVYSSVPSLDFTVSDDIAVNECWHSLDGGTTNISLPGCSNLSSIGNEGANSLILFANDTSGNTNTASVSFTINSPAIDSTPPVISMQSPISTTYSITPSLNLTVSDDVAVSECWYSLDGGITNALLPGCGNLPNIGIEGENTLIVYANDTSGNSNSVNVSFTINSLFVKTGFYDGDGTSTKSITGLGFSPEMVIVRGNGTNAGNITIFKTSSMQSGYSMPLGIASGGALGNITSLDSDGFTVGTGLNKINNKRYYWIAVRDDSNLEFVEGNYSGSPSNISLPFSPALVWIKRNGSTPGVYRESFDTGTYVTTTTASPVANMINSLDSGGFTLGTNVAVRGGGTYYYFAFNVSDNFVIGSYTGSGASNTISIGFSPDFVHIHKQNGGQLSVFRTKDMVNGKGVNLTGYYGLNAYLTNGIVSFGPNGFSLGSSAAVNTLGSPYQYFALKAS